MNFRSSRADKYWGRFSTVILFAAASLLNGAEVETQVNKPAPNAVTDDALKGLPCHFEGAFNTGREKLDPTSSSVLLTDGVFSDAATLIVQEDWIKRQAYIIWDLGENAADRRELQSVTVWVPSEDPGRSGFTGHLEVADTYSPGDYSGRIIPGTHIDEILTARSNPEDGKGTGLHACLNSVTWTFAPHEVKGFRYLVLSISNLPNRLAGRLVEVTANISNKPHL